jgi:hypothetical protein
MFIGKKARQVTGCALRPGTTIDILHSLIGQPFFKRANGRRIAPEQIRSESIDPVDGNFHFDHPFIILD